MTVTNTNSRVAYTGSPPQTSFTVTFPFYDEDDLEVRERVIATGAETVKVLGVDYSVTGGGGSTGTVEATTAPATTVQWIITRTTKRTQESDYVNDSTLQQETVEDDLDRNSLRDIEIDREIARSLKAPQSDDPSVSTEIPSSVDRASKYLAFDASGVPVSAAAPADTTTLSTFGATLGLSADAAAARANLLTERIDADTIGNRPAASGFGTGFFYATDIDQLYYSDGSAWSLPVGPGQFAQASLPAAVTAGRLYLDTDNLILKRDSGAALEDIRAPFPRGYLSGFALSLSGSNQDVTVGDGEARAGTAASPSLMNAYHSAITKQCDATWASGTNAGGRAAGTSNGARTWWYVFVLVHPDGSTDAGIDTDPNAANLLADAAVSAAGFTRFVYVGRIQETLAGTGAMEPFIQDKGDFWWPTPRSLTFSNADHTTQTDLDVTTILPDGPGIRGETTWVWTGLGVVSQLLVGLSSAQQTIPAPTGGSSGSGPGNHMGSEVENGGQIFVYPDSSGEISVRVAGDTSVGFITTAWGWHDNRLA